MTPRIRHPGRWLAASLVVAGLVAGAVLTVQHTRSRALHAALPDQPDLTTWPAELRDRVARAEARFRSGSDPTAALGELSRLYHANGFLREAAHGYRGLTQADADNPRWPHLLASILTGFGEAEAALPWLKKTTALAPDYLPARLRLGDVLLKAGRPEEAAVPYAAVLQRAPTDPYASLGTARVAIAAEQWSAAAAHLERTVREHPEFQAAWNVLANVRQHLGEERAATAARAGAVSARRFRDPPDPWLDELLLECYDPDRLGVAATIAVNGNDRALARRLLERVLALAPEDTTALRQMGQLRREGREFSEARPFLERAVTLAPRESDNWVQLYLLLNTVGDGPGAERALADGLRHCPESPALLLEKGRRLKTAGRFDEALAALEESARLRPTEAEAFNERAGILFRLERVDDAILDVRRALAAQPADPLALILLTRALILKGDAAGATETITKIRHQVRVRPQDLQTVLEAFHAKFGRMP